MCIRDSSTTISFDVTDTQTARIILLSLAETVGSRLRSHGVKAEVVAVSIKNSQLKTQGLSLIHIWHTISADRYRPGR